MIDSLINPQAIGEISKDLGQIFFASIFLSSLMSGNIDYFVVIIGFVLSVSSWSFYIITRKY